MTLAQIIAQLRSQTAAKLSERNKIADELAELRAAGTEDADRVAQLRSDKDALDAELDEMQRQIPRRC